MDTVHDGLHPDLIRRIAEQHFKNASEIVRCYLAHTTLPPLDLRSGLTLYHGPSDPVPLLIYEIFHKSVYTSAGFYEPSEGDFIVDCGANIGVFALYLLSLNRRIRLLCVEPCTSTRQRLVKNIDVNQLSMIKVLPYGLLKEDMYARMSHARSSGESSLIKSQSFSDMGPHEEVFCISLRVLLSLVEVPFIDLLKIDIEGAELTVLQDAADAEWTRVRRVALEYHNYLVPHCSDAIMSLLTDYGFTRVECHGDEYEGIIRASRHTT